MAGLLPDPAVGVANSKAREGGELWGSPGIQPGRPEEGRVQFCGAATPHRGDLPESSRCDQDPPRPCRHRPLESLAPSRLRESPSF